MALEDDYIVGTFAIWAGDIAYARERLSEVVTASLEPGDRIWPDERLGYATPLSVMQAEASDILQEIANKQGEFETLRNFLGPGGTVLQSQPEPLYTAHLRGALWRIGARDFLMKAYPMDLEWADGLLDRARDAVARMGQLAPPPGPSQSTISWVIPGRLFIQSDLTGIGLIEATGVWTATPMPQDDELKAAFRRVLEMMEES